ncbi:hypothetical protein ASPZODRAFT_24007 [Penicilliopsis zonata CBS 506.65]|uniref:Nitrogen regulatory protein areA GATA-like domain-containing protein n=1 Tax=Penicilliopsis zonata CBS 506.65 TaxID=1073090 RepID=A0A1L9SM98_9EURO|nr:hypothetical protein ASPZODRAFT_24007 [Penicilliopsis zonata CBS 506.65]OJJ48369.1 hypothetical protein ASPZODRAFT_24007 [Penicilliopsis zonata CBS 506.65]
MTDSLPKGLMATTSQLPSKFDDPDAVEVEDIIRLWRVYATNPRVMNGDEGHRLENLFWRILSSDHVRGSIQGATLAKIFSHISEEPSPLVHLRGQGGCAEEGSKTIEQAPPKDGNKPTSQSVPGPAQQPLLPILKKNGSQSESQKTTRLLLPPQIGEYNVNKPPKASLNPPTAPTLSDTSSKQGQRRTHIVAIKASNGRRRPVMIRRKSSQASTDTLSTQKSRQTLQTPQTPRLELSTAPTSPSPRNAFEEEPDLGDNPVDRQSPDESSEAPEPFMSTSPKKPLTWLDVGRMASKPRKSREPQDPATVARCFPYSFLYSNSDMFTESLRDEDTQPSHIPLVQRNFRTRYVEKQREEVAACSLKTSSSLSEGLSEATSRGIGFSLPATSSTHTNLTVPSFSTSHHSTHEPDVINDAPAFRTPAQILPQPRSSLSALFQDDDVESSSPPEKPMIPCDPMGDQFLPVPPLSRRKPYHK